MVTKKSVSTSDGVTLSYLEAGSGKPLVLIPGWSQTAEQFKHQIEGLLGRYRVIALDICGHSTPRNRRSATASSASPRMSRMYSTHSTC